MATTTELHELLRRRGASGGSALSQLMARPPAHIGVDFMAFERGRRARREADREDRLGSLQEQLIAQEMQDAQGRRQAQRYLTSVMGNMQRATDAGIPVSDFLTEQRDQILTDPNFEKFDVSVQEQILRSLGQTASARAQRLYQAGDFGAAQQLADAFGFIGPSRPFDQFRGSTDPLDPIRHAIEMNPEGPLQIADDGSVTYMGEAVDPNQVALSLLESQQPASVWNIGAQQAHQAQVDELMRQFGGPAPPEAAPQETPGDWRSEISRDASWLDQPARQVIPEDSAPSQPRDLAPSTDLIPPDLLEYDPGIDWQDLIQFRTDVSQAARQEPASRLLGRPSTWLPSAKERAVDEESFVRSLPPDQQQIIRSFEPLSAGEIQRFQSGLQDLQRYNQLIPELQAEAQAALGRPEGFGQYRAATDRLRRAEDEVRRLVGQLESLRSRIGSQ